MSGDPVITRAGGRQLSEQQRAAQQLRALAKLYRFRVRADTEGFPIIPGRYGQIEWFDGEALAVYCDHPRLFRKLWAIANVRRHQTGDREMRAVFPPEALAQVAGVIRAMQWGGTGRGRPENFSSKHGHLATSRPLEPIPDAGRLPGPGATPRKAKESLK